MDKANRLIEEIYEHYSEHLEMLSDDEACGLVIRALAYKAVKAQDELQFYKSALHRCELSKR